MNKNDEIETLPMIENKYLHYQTWNIKKLYLLTFSSELNYYLLI